MNTYKSGLCFLPSLILVILSTGSVGSINCPGPYNCSCLKVRGGEYELLCPGTGHVSVLSASIIPDKYVHIQCTYATHFTDYNLLNGLRVGPVPTLNFRLCPLPNLPFSDLIKSIGVDSTNSLFFQSYRNLSNTLERKHFQGLGNLSRLVLSSNGLTHLPKDLLQDLTNLTWLDLRGNNLRVHSNFFSAVPNLLTLELGNNNLTYLEPGLFRNLTKLRSLNLWKNQIKNLTREALSHLTNLTDIDLNFNGMNYLSENVFEDLQKLITANLNGNNFSRVPNLFSKTPHLEILKMYDNRQTLTLPNRFLFNLTELKEVYMMRSNLQEVPEDMFWESPYIMNISFQGNSLRHIPKNLLRDQVHLQTLDLSYNQLWRLPDGVFKHLGSLRFLRLGNNHLENLTRDVFQGLDKLELLDLEYNDLKYLDSEAMRHLVHLKHARLSHNMLTFLEEEEDHILDSFNYKDTFGNKSPFQHCVELEYLYLANNSITEIFSDWRVALARLKVLDLSHNHLHYILVQDIQYVSHDLSVDLRHNNISTINLYGLETLAIGQTINVVPSQIVKRKVRILLEGNPLRCDCEAYEMIRYFENKLQKQVYELVNLIPGNLTCSDPKSLEGFQATQVKSQDLMCTLNDNYNCPPSCECKIRRADWGLIVNCTDKGLTEVPKELPLVRFTNHTELFLSGNDIDNLPNATYSGYENVTHLHLSRNRISAIDTGFLSAQIQELTVDHNNLSKFSSNLVRFLGQSDRIRLLKLNNNPWLCDCSAKDLLDLIQLKFKEIPLLSNVTCSQDQKPLSHLSVSDLCPVSMAIVVSCIVLAAFGVFVGSVAVFYYRYQKEVKIWLYSHHFCLWFVTEQELDKDKLYDAFVSYSHKDENFVIGTLVPELEVGEPPFKLCLHYRDWIAGEWIPNQIARSVENSRRTLVVLSPNFLESVWGRMEFRAAHKQALSEGRARVIVVLYGDVGPTDQLDPELRAYISMNTYVKWGDPWFWRKLKYALPHPPSLAKSHLHLFKGRGSRKEKNYIDDKLELIHTLDSPHSPVSGTTPPAEAAVTTMETVTVPNTAKNAKTVA